VVKEQLQSNTLSLELSHGENLFVCKEEVLAPGRTTLQESGFPTRLTKSAMHPVEPLTAEQEVVAVSTAG
jgi:hypothetical protein